MNQIPGPRDNRVDSDALLAAYQLLIETTVESEGDDVMLQRALVILASIPWLTPHRFFSVLLPSTDASALRLVASVGGPDAVPPPCDDVCSTSCLCGRALVRPERLLWVDAAAEPQRPRCDPRGSGIHLILPLSARGRVLGVLHALIESSAPPGKSEQAFLVQVATLLGAELRRHRSERDHDRLEMQFLQAQKIEAVGRLAGGVAHDFNNILTAITNYADLGLLKLPAESPLRRNFDEIIAATDRAALLTQQLLAFSRRQVLTPRVIDVNAVIAELGKALRRLLGADIALSITTDPALARIVADAALIEQLIINLAMNARDALPRGGTISLATANAEFDVAYTLSHPAVAPGTYGCLALTLNGPGMAADFLDALGGPGGAAQEPGAGVTLGPAAIKDIIQQGGGHAQFVKSPDSGTTVRICFPAASAAAAGMAPQDKAFGLPRGSETILIAEDDDSVRVVIGEVLRDLGYQVLEARGGQEALGTAAEHPGPIDVLLTDLVLPGSGGVELHRRLCAARPGLRVLYISGVMDEAAAQPGLATAGAVILQKPFSPWSLASRLRAMLDAPPSGPG